MKKIWIILAIIVVMIFAIIMAKDAIIKASIEKAVYAVTGLKLDIGSISAGIFNGIVDIKRITLANPPNFSEKIMVDMPEVYVHYDLPAIMKGRIHLPEARFALKEFFVVKNQKGELNLNALKSVQAYRAGRPSSQSAPGKTPEIMIDRLTLRIGKVIYRDYSMGGAPLIREFNINLNETYTNVDDPYKLVNLIVVKALMDTTIAGLANFDVGGLEGTVGDVLATTKKIAAVMNGVQGTAGKTMKTATQTATQTAKQAQDTVKQAAEAAKDIFRNQFGSGE